MSGLWAHTGPPDPALAARMTAALVHRSRGRSPTVDAGSRATLGLAAFDRRLGWLGARGDVCVAFAGRMPLVHHDDFVAAAARRDVRGAAAFGGEWVLAVRTAGRLLIARDAAGVRTVYWGRHHGRVLVGVEPKVVLAAPGFPRRVDPTALVQYLAFSFVPGERCGLADLHELPAGHQLDIDLRSGCCEVTRWFVHEDIEVEEGDPADWVSATRSVIDAAVDSRLPDGERVSSFLSGGLDSSIVTAVAAECCKRRGLPPPATWSLHFGDRYPNELPFAAAVAARAGTDHHVVEVSAREVAANLRQLVWHLDEPIGDPVTAGTFALARSAGAVSPWILNGEGGDPVFGGPKNLPMLLEHWYRSDSDVAFREARYLATWRRAAEEIERLVHPDLLADVDLHDALHSVVGPFLNAARPEPFLNKLMVANMRLKGAHLILPKVDRMVGAFGGVQLSPLFDPAVIELSLRMPPAAKLRDGVEKWILKQAYADLLPPEVVGRPKSGMRVPVRWWFRRELRPLARDVLSPRAVRRAGVFQADTVRDIRRYRTGRDGLRLWMLVTFELWRRTVIDGEAP